MASHLWNNDKIINFIDAVRSRGCLWDIKNPDYRDRTLKRDEWTAIGFDYHISPDEAAKKFKNLRTYFNNELKKMEKKQKSGATQGSSWFAFKNMLFLKDTDDADAGIDSEVQSGQEQDESSEDDTTIPCPQLLISTPGAPLPAKRRKKTHGDILYQNSCELLEKVDEMLSNKSSAFVNYVNEKLLAYSDYVRNQVQFKMTKILYEADMGYYDKPHSFLIKRNHKRNSTSSEETHSRHSPISSQGTYLPSVNENLDQNRPNSQFSATSEQLNTYPKMHKHVFRAKPYRESIKESSFSIKTDK